MKVTIHTTRGGIKIADMGQGSVLALVEALNNPQHPPFYQFNLDDTSTHYVNIRHIVQVDIDEPKSKD